jgi:polyisoprenoid-binding protein YceI
MKHLLALLAALSVAWAHAEAKLVSAGSEIAFTSKQMGVPVDGKFRRFDASVRFDPKQPDAARIGLTIDLASVSLGTAEVEAEVVGPDWFAAKQFPQASFESTGVKPAGAGRFDVAGKLTIKGVTRDLVAPVTLATAGGNTVASGSFAIRRLDFRIGAGEWGDTSLVADEVTVRFRLMLAGTGPW